MRLVTFNVLHGRSLEDGQVNAARLAEEIGSLQADVLGLQEVDRAQPRSALVDVAAVAAAAMGAGTSYRFAPALLGTPGADWSVAGDGDEDRAGDPAYGIALVTRLPVLSWHVVRLRAAPMRSLVVVPGATSRRLILIRDEPRVLLAAVVQGPGGPLTVATTHLSFVPGWNIWQLRRVCRELRRLPAPQILLGDLNLPGALAGAASGWRMLARAATYPAGRPRVQLDHVLAKGRVPPVTATAARSLRISDHCALVVDLALGSQQETETEAPVGLFGNKEKKAAQSAALQAEYERLGALPLPELATEVMERGFGPGGPGGQLEIKVNALFDLYAPMKSAFGVDFTPRLKIEDLLKDAAAALEHAGLLVMSPGGEGGNLQYAKSRAGQDALDAGDVRGKLGA